MFHTQNVYSVALKHTDDFSFLFLFLLTFFSSSSFLPPPSKKKEEKKKSYSGIKLNSTVGLNCLDKETTP